MENNKEVIMQIRGLKKYFPVKAGSIFSRNKREVKAVDGIDLDIYRGETLGLVGESGSGKSTTGWTITQLYRPTSGSVIYKGYELTKISSKKLCKIRKDLQIIFQDPYASINPRMSVEEIISEPLTTRKDISAQKRKNRVGELMEMVGLNPTYRNLYPHQFSGGQRQRIVIARALALNPSFIICDEAIASLDVSIQAQIINLLGELQKQLNLTYLFISHDLDTVQYISDRIAVMYLGRIVEIATSDELFQNPVHPYTRALLSAVPIMEPRYREEKKHIILNGDIPSPVSPPSGCRFRTRCQLACEECAKLEPELIDIGNGHLVSCIKLHKAAAVSSDSITVDNQCVAP